MSDAASPGCPSGLSPATGGDAAAVDPSPFVRSGDGVERLELVVFGAKCAGCISKIEGALNRLSGMEEARLNLSTGRLTAAWRAGAVDPKMIVSRLSELGYRAAPFDPKASEADHDAEGRRLLRALAVAGFAMANIMLLSISVWSGEGEMGAGTRGLMHLVSALIAIPAALYAGRPFFQSAYRALRNGRANMDVPISLAVLLALGLSTYEFFAGGEALYFDAAVMLLFFLLIGRYLDHRLRWRAREAARDLLALQATTATVMDAGGDARVVATRDVRPGDLIALAPGDRAPVDGIIEEGDSLVDASLVTGESAPARLRAGDVARAGVLNQTARLTLRATATADTSLLADLTRLIEAGEQSKSRYVRLADKAAALYVPVVHSLAAATFLGWLIIGEAGLRVSMMNAIAVLIITCPCALGLAAPAVQVVATGRLFRAGILVKSGDALERLAEATRFVFDKTGTLTIGRPALRRGGDVGEETLGRAARLARASKHPLSRAIVEAVGAGPLAEDVNETPGGGVEGVVASGVSARLGSAAFVGIGDGGTVDDVSLEAWYAEEGATPVRLRFDDPPRADAEAALGALGDRGLPSELLSGDRPAVAAAMADRLGLTDWRGGIDPAGKTRRIKELSAAGEKVAMVGDGLNDAPSLAGAHVSLSPGGAADATQAAADIVYGGDGLSAIVEAVDVARTAKRRVLQNFAFAAAYNACAVPLAAAGHVTPLIAALAMSGSSIIVTLNALRLAGGGKRPRGENGARMQGAPAEAPA